jgi:hypothetical protein
MAAQLEMALQRQSQVADVENYREAFTILLQDTEPTRIYPEYKEQSTLSLSFEEARLRKTIGKLTQHDISGAEVIGELVLDKSKLDRPGFSSTPLAEGEKLLAEIKETIAKLDSL